MISPRFALMLRLALAAPFALVASFAASAQDGEPSVRVEPLNPPAAADARPVTRLDRLFEDLREAETESEAVFIAEEIDAIWSDAKSPSALLFTDRAASALAFGEIAAARRLVDGALDIDPDLVAAWSQSALVAYAAEDYARALEDINHALALEPRHFHSLVGLGTILERLQRWSGAYDAYTRALELYPLMEGARDRADALETRALGRDL